MVHNLNQLIETVFFLMTTHLHGIHGIKLCFSVQKRRHSLCERVAKLNHLLIGRNLIRTALRSIFRLNRHNLFNYLLALIDLKVDVGILVHSENFRVVLVW